MSGSRSLFAGLTMLAALAVAAPGGGGERAALHRQGFLGGHHGSPCLCGRRQQGSDLPGLRGAARHRFQPGGRAAARARPGRSSTRRTGSSSCARACASTTARRSPPTTSCSASSARRRRPPTSRTGSTGSRPSKRSDDHTIRFTTTAPDPSLWLKLADVAIMSRAWAAGARRVEARGFRRRARGDLCLAPRQRYRAVRARIVRTAWRLGHGPQSRLVGHGRLPAQHRPHRPRPESRSRRTSPPCSTAEIDLLQTSPILGRFRQIRSRSGAEARCTGPS